MGGASASTPNGTNPAVPAGSFTYWNDLAGPWDRVEWSVRPDLDTQGGVEYNKMVGFFTDTNEHLQLTNGTVPANKYAYIVVHWNIAGSALNAIKAAHPAAKVLAYQNLGGMIAGPHTNSRPTSLVTQEEATTHGTGADDWRLHKESDASVVVFSDFTYLQAAHIGRASWRTQAASHFAQIATDGFHGVMLDDTNMKPGHGFNEGEANDSTEFASNNAYRDAVTGAMASLKTAATAQGLLVVPNVGMDPWVVDEYAGYTTMLAANSLDGVLREFWTNWAGASVYFDGATWTDTMKVQTDAEAAGKFAVLHSLPLSTPDDTRSIRYGLASFYLHWNGVTASGVGYNDGRPLSSFAQYRKLVNAPTETKQLVSGTTTDGAWMRHFTGGVVIANAKSASGLVTFNLGGTYIDPSGASVTSVQLDSKHGMVLLTPTINDPGFGSGYFWSKQGYLRNAAGTATGSTWYAGLQSRSSLSGTPKGAIFSIWGAVAGVAGDIAGTVSQAFSGEGTGWQLIAPYGWTAGRTYSVKMEKDEARGPRWFAAYFTDTVTGITSWLGSIQAATSDGSDLSGVSYQWTELFSQVTPATSCPLLPRSTTFFETPTFSRGFSDILPRALANNVATSGTGGVNELSVSPTGMQPDDWLIFEVISVGGSTTHSNIAGGAVRVHNDFGQGSTTTISTWKRKVSSTSTVTYTFQLELGDSHRMQVAVRAYSGGDPIDIVEQAPAAIGVTAQSLAVTGVTPQSQGRTHLLLGGSNSPAGGFVGFGEPSGYQEKFDRHSVHASNANACLFWAERALPDAAAVGTKSFTIGGSTNKALGLNPDATTTQIGLDLDHLQTLGVRTVWMVLAMEWGFPTNTTVDATVATKWDAIVNGAHARGMTVAIQAHGNPAWNVTAGGHTPPGNPWHGPDNATERANWVTMLHNALSRWGSAKVGWVEVWNEPNLTGFWNNTGGISPDNYVRLMRDTYVDIKASWPDIKVVGHNMSRNHIGWLNTCYTSTDTIYGASTAAANNYYFDVMGVHPYCGNETSGYDPAVDNHADETTALGPLDPDFLGYRRLRSAILTKEGKDKTLAIGEFGYAVSGSGWFLVTETNRRAWIVSAMALARDDNYIDYFNIYYHRPTDASTDYWTSFNIHPSAGATGTETDFDNFADFLTSGGTNRQLVGASILLKPASGTGVGTGGGTQQQLPQMGVWRQREGTWTEDNITGAEAEFGPFAGHIATYKGGGAAGSLSTAELAAVDAGHTIHVYWKVSSNWATTVGGTRDAAIDAAADSFKSRPGTEFWFTPWHEPENDLTSNGGSAGTAAQFRAHWQYVWNRFQAKGVTNVKFVWVIMSSAAHPADLDDLWPGNAYVHGVGVQRYIRCFNPASDLAVRWLQDLNWFWDNYAAGTRNWRPKKADGTGDVFFAFTEWGSELGGNDWACGTIQNGQEGNRRTNRQEVADAIDGIRGILGDLATWGVKELRYFDAKGTSTGSNWLTPKPGVDALAFQELKDTTEEGAPGVFNLVVRNVAQAQTVSKPTLTIPSAPTLPPPVQEPVAWYMPTGAQNPNNHQTSEVYNALTGRTGSRRWSFRYELLSNTHTRIMDLDEVTACTVEHQYLADIKRKATFTIRDHGRINYLSNRVRPWVRLHLEPLGTNDWVEWPLGVFLLASPMRHANEFDVVEREVQGYDPLQYLADDMVATRYSVAAGVNIVNTVATLVAGAVPTWRITRSSETLTAAKEWPPGTSKLVIANNLLAIAEYESVSFDSFGRGIIKPYAPPDERAPMWTYAFGPESIIHPGVDQELDLFSIPNKWVAVVSQPDQPLLVASYTNTNPASPTSTVRRGRTIVDFREEEEASSQTVLNTKVKRLGLAASQIYEHIVFETGLMPIHGTNDVMRLVYDPLAISAVYSETSWTIECESGARMKHEARRLVSI